MGVTAGWKSRFAARAAAPGLLAHYKSVGQSDHAGFSPEHYLRVSTRPQFQDILRAAPRGTVDPSIDPDDVFDLMLGAMLAHAIVPTVAARHAPLERTVDLLIRAMKPV